MSDDEYYDPDYDDFHEMLYDADASPELADDLAERATYSPLWQDNPTEELRDYFSDWEYYSDDYFDDDPDLLNGVSKTGDGQKLGQRPRQPVKRGRKRKFSEAREPPELKEELDALTSCLRGTVWKSRSPEPGIVYRQGVDSPVALQLSEEIMRSAYSWKRGFGKGRLRQDESWANDLSLADMGLKAERSLSMPEQPKPDDDEEDEEPGEDAMEDDIGSVDEEAVQAETVVKELHRVNIQTEPAPIDSVIVQEEADRGSAARKRQKLSMSAQETERQIVLPEPEDSRDRDQANVDMEGVANEESLPAKRGRGRPKKPATVSKVPAEEKMKEVRSNAGPGRKRRLSTSSATGPTASSRAKRLDTKQDLAGSKPEVITAAATRPTRNRKK